MTGSKGQPWQVARLLLVMVQLLVVVNSFRTSPMGAINKECDDAVTNIQVDWDPQSSAEYTCDGRTLHLNKMKLATTSENKTDEPFHVCLPSPIHYHNIPPLSGNHRPNWAVYGEYTYLPPQRWLHNLEHGAIVMLYHPCADPSQVDQLRNIVTHCLRRFIITPYKLLPKDMPLALLSWGHKLLMSRVDATVATNYIKSHARKGSPEKDVASDGKYNTSLTEPAKIVSGSDYHDSNLCPHNNAQASQAAVFARHKPFRSFIRKQSQRRVHQINRATNRLKDDVKRLIHTYRKLVSKK